MQDSQTIVSTYSPNPEFARSNEYELVLPKFQAEPDRPPSLDYDIASKKRSIAINALMILIINGITPALLYYILEYGTNVSRSTMINIVEITTTLTLVQWPWRLWTLLRRGGERAPRNRTPLTWDNFQWNFLIGIVPVATCCVLAGIKLSMRWYMFGPVVLFGQNAIQMILSWVLARAKVRSLFQMSSVPAGEPIRPAVYYLVEDVTACDGGGGQGYRDRLNVRWEASPQFRKLLEDITLYQGLGFLVHTMVQVTVLFATDEKVFVAASTFILWGWCGLTGVWSIYYTKRALQEEKLWWAANRLSEKRPSV